MKNGRGILLQIFTPVQEARSIVEAHPANPDALQLACYLEAVEAGEEAAWRAQLECDIQRGSATSIDFLRQEDFAASAHGTGRPCPIPCLIMRQW